MTRSTRARHGASSGPRIRPALRKELAVGVLFVLAATLVPVAAGNPFWQQIMLLACVYIIAAVGLDVLRSQAGQMSFGQGAVMGVAAYATALATVAWELPSPLPVVVGLLAGMAAGMLMSLPSLRVQSYYLGFVTMAGALALPEVLYLFKDQTMAMTGVNVPPSALHTVIVGGLDWLTVVVTLSTVTALVLAAVLRSSRYGRNMLLAGSSVEAAATVGLGAGRLRLQAFALSSLAASVAGVLYVGVIQYVAPGSFTLALSVLLYFIVIVGGPGKVLGPIAGVVLLYLVPDQALSSLLDYRLLIYGAIVFAVMFVMPDGAAGGLARLIARRRRASGSGAGTISLAPILQRAPERGEATASGEPLLVATGVRRSFGSVKALDGADLRVDRGTLHAIVGPNGSGKTTLLNAVSGLIDLDEGTVEFDGDDITTASAPSRARRGLARTFQKPRVLGGLSVWENIDTGRSARSIEWIEQALQEQSAAWDGVDGSALPHGQRRFVEVLRALHSGPTMIALDEPAAGLSTTERVEFGRLMREVVATTGVTVLMVEHDLELVWNSADRISVVDGGRVIASGAPAELRNSQKIAHLFAGVDHVGS